MSVIYKFPLHGSETFIRVTEQTTILDADFQGDQLCVWALIDKSHPVKHRTILLLMTGEEWNGPGKLNHIATRQRNGIVVHVFEWRSPLE